MSAPASKPAVSSQKRPLEDSSSPSAPTDQPDAKRPALDKTAKADEANLEEAAQRSAGGPAAAAKPEPTTTSENPIENGTKDSQGDTAIPDAPTAIPTADALDGNNQLTTAGMKLETHPIQSTIGSNDHGSRMSSHPPHQDESSWIHVRAVISSAEAATVIGKGGENVTQIRRLSGAKCTVSDYSRGAVERILTVSGLVDATAKVCISLV